MDKYHWNASLGHRCRLANILYLSLYHAVLLTTLREHGQEEAAELKWKIMHAHQKAHFLDGVKKLGLEGESSGAVKCGKYHYFSNRLGGMEAEYMEESPEKVWIRYPAPYPLSDSPFTPSVALAAFSAKFGFATYSGWYAYNGPSLGNPRLGFVLTHSIHSGDPFSAGYFKIYDHDLDQEERLQFRPGERPPRFDPSTAPELPVADWNEERKAKAMRNYAVEYLNTAQENLLDRYGIEGARHIVAHAYRVAFVQRSRQLIEGLELPDASPRSIALMVQRDRALLNEEAELEERSEDRYVVRQRARHPRLFPNLDRAPVELDEAALQGWRVLAGLINPDVTIDMTSALTAEDPYYEWVVRPRAARLLPR